jgi:acyl carrier protein
MICGVQKMTKSDIFESLKKHMLEDLYLEDVTEDDIQPETHLFDEHEGLGLDSLDAVELVTLIEKYYAIQITNPAEVKEYFFSMDTLSDYIFRNAPHKEQA